MMRYDADFDVALMFLSVLSDHGHLDPDGVDVLIDSLEMWINEGPGFDDRARNRFATWLGALRRWRDGDDLIDALRALADIEMYCEVEE